MREHGSDTSVLLWNSKEIGDTSVDVSLTCLLNALKIDLDSKDEIKSKTEFTNLNSVH